MFASGLAAPFAACERNSKSIRKRLLRDAACTEPITVVLSVESGTSHLEISKRLQRGLRKAYPTSLAASDLASYRLCLEFATNFGSALRKLKTDDGDKVMGENPAPWPEPERRRS